MNQVWFIGAGPGDPQLLTLEGAERLAAAHLVFAPPPYEQLFAERLTGKRVEIPFAYPYAQLLRLIRTELARGEVAFLIPGDMTFYSPFQALADALGEQARVVPGVGTANAAAAWLKKTLDLPGFCNRTILCSPRTLGDGDHAAAVAELAAPGVTLIIYMNNLPLTKLVAELRSGYGENVPIALFHRLCLPGQEVFQGRLDDIVARVGERDLFNLTSADQRPALTLVVAGETLAASASGDWWDFRYQNLWRERYASDQSD